MKKIYLSIIVILCSFVIGSYFPSHAASVDEIKMAKEEMKFKGNDKKRKKEKQFQICGNGILERGEQCDDGNSTDGDACLNNCRRASCGDGFIWQGTEECDDGNGRNWDGCNLECYSEIPPYNLLNRQTKGCRFVASDGNRYHYETDQVIRIDPSASCPDEAYDANAVCSGSQPGWKVRLWESFWVEPGTDDFQNICDNRNWRDSTDCRLMCIASDSPRCADVQPLEVWRFILLPFFNEDCP